MRQRVQFSWHNLRDMVADLAVLVGTPDGRQTIADRLECRLRRSKLAQATVDKARLMYDYFRDPAEPAGPKWLMGTALLFLLIPTKRIPGWLRLFWFADDFAAIAFVWSQTQDILTRYDERRRQRLASSGAVEAA